MAMLKQFLTEHEGATKTLDQIICMMGSCYAVHNPDRSARISVRVARLQNETGRRNIFKSIRKWFEKRKKKDSKKHPKNDPKRVRKCLSPSHAA